MPAKNDGVALERDAEMPSNRQRPRARSARFGDNDPEFVWGAAAIGRVIGKDEKSTFYLLEKKALRGTAKVSGQYVGSVPILRAQMRGASP